MLILLPPSETKRSGGEGAPWDSSRLELAELTPIRESVIDALVRVSDDPDAAAAVLKLGPKQRGEIEVNRALRMSSTMPAIDRYTGVLFDALDASSLGLSARQWLGEHVLIHSAPFGPVGALDPIPSYRLGAGIRLPGLASHPSMTADRRTLNHFNKNAKGRLARALAEFGADLSDAAQFVRWANDAGFETDRDGDVITLVVPRC